MTIQIERITKMEALLDECSASIRHFEEELKSFEAFLPKINELASYYTSRDWRADFDASSNSQLPKDLKCGVLSEDAVFDLLRNTRETALKMADLSIRFLKGDTDR